MSAVDKIFTAGGSILRLIPAPRVVKIPKGINRGMKWIRRSANAWEWLGIYESDKQALVRKVTTPGMCIFDIGANAGFYTLAFSHLVGANGHVLAIEPFAGNVQKILNHIRLNQLANVCVVQGAASERTQIAHFEIGRDDFTGRITNSSRGLYCVPCFSLDDLISYCLVPDPDLLKIDVEGAELSVLMGARGILSRKSPAILVALHSDELKQQCRSWLSTFGYQFFDLAGKKLNSTHALPDEIYALAGSRSGSPYKGNHAA